MIQWFYYSFTIDLCNEGIQAHAIYPQSLFRTFCERWKYRYSYRQSAPETAPRCPLCERGIEAYLLKRLGAV